MKHLMLQGTASNAGKSAVTAGLARLLTRQGFKVKPFKPQNMSNNAAVTKDGGEIGRAQAFQAFAANTPPQKLMNPILLKPEGNNSSQLIILGERAGQVTAREYYKRKDELLAVVCDAYRKLHDDADVVLVEGAGSPAEVNLRAHDIANMGFATKVNLPVLLIADIDRGGVIANIIGTYFLLDEAERALLKGYIINKFRGDETLFADAITRIKMETGLDCFGIIHHHEAVKFFADEDSLSIVERMHNQYNKSHCHIAVPRLPNISNADDFSPLAEHPAITLEFVPLDTALPPCDWVIIPGTKNTIADLIDLQKAGWKVDLQAHLRRDGKILGLCGGYQMLGKSIKDPLGIENADIKEVAGLGFLDSETVLAENKILQEISVEYNGIAVQGYEIHLGKTTILGGDDAFLTHHGKAYGTVSGSQSPYYKNIFGCYLHGIFNNTQFCNAFFELADSETDGGLAENWDRKADKALDDFADYLAEVLDIEKILKLIG